MYVHIWLQRKDINIKWYICFYKYIYHFISFYINISFLYILLHLYPFTHVCIYLYHICKYISR